MAKTLTPEKKELLSRVIAHFGIEESAVIAPYGNGHIHETYCVESNVGRFILQKVNTVAFSDMEKLMENIMRVTRHLHTKLEADGRDPREGTLTVIPTVFGFPWLRYEGDTYRLYIMIVGETRETPCVADMEAAGEGFGDFQNMLADFPAAVLHEAIPHFHDTPRRLEALRAAVKADKIGRMMNCHDLVAIAESEVELAHSVMNALSDGSLPLRVTHNDTKLNNVLFDRASGKVKSVIDLDTVMPGSLLYDFGDALRFGMTTAAEDEPDVTKVGVSLDLYRAFARGFIRAAGKSMTAKEKELLPLSPLLLTYECGIRFLTDYLDGDNYFHIAYKDHNLVRARNQLTLLARMRDALPDMERITKEVLNEYHCL